MSTTAAAKPRDPLTKHGGKPLPGESARERLEDYLLLRLVVWVALPWVFAAAFLIDLMRTFFPGPPRLMVDAIGFVIVAPISAWQLWRLYHRVQPWIQGAHGERRVGQLLEELRREGYEVFHDIDTKGQGNIDHVLIGPAGIFAVETKAISLPGNRSAKIEYDGERLSIDGKNPADWGDRDPLNQARTSAKCLGAILQSCTGRRYDVRPVLLYPGWFVEERPGAEVWVLNPDRIFASLRRAKAVMDAEQVSFVAANLTRWFSEKSG